MTGARPGVCPGVRSEAGALAAGVSIRSDVEGAD